MVITGNLVAINDVDHQLSVIQFVICDKGADKVELIPQVSRPSRIQNLGEVRIEPRIESNIVHTESVVYL